MLLPVCVVIIPSFTPSFALCSHVLLTYDPKATTLHYLPIIKAHRGPPYCASKPLDSAQAITNPYVSQVVCLAPRLRLQRLNTFRKRSFTHETATCSQERSLYESLVLVYSLTALRCEIEDITHRQHHTTCCSRESLNLIFHQDTLIHAQTRKAPVTCPWICTQQFCPVASPGDYPASLKHPTLDCQQQDS